MALGREMTKPYEEFFFGPLSEISKELSSRDKVLGEVCWGIRGIKPGERPVTQEELEAAIAEALAAGLPVKKAAKELSERFGLSSKILYTQISEAKKNLTR